MSGPGRRRGRVIALLGAESTGKTTLVAALTARLQAAGLDAVGVDERLRRFCDEAGRTPRQDEQAGLAETQQRRIEAAAARHAWVVADTTALQTAVYSIQVFGDGSLVPAALAAHAATVDFTLLTGLDLPWVADGLQRDGPEVRIPVDAALRAWLGQAGLPHAVVYGLGPAREAAALQALAAALPEAAGLASAAAAALGGPPGEARSADDGLPFSRWRAACAACAEPDPARPCDRHPRGWLTAGARP